MGGERLFPGQADPGSSAAISPDNRGLGQQMTITQAGRMVVGGGFWVQSGVYPERWQLWNKDSSTRLLDMALAALSPSGTGWRYFYFAELGLSPFGPLVVGTNYIPATWTPSGAGNYVFTNGGFSYPFGQGPLSTTNPPIFRNAGTSAQVPNDATFSGGRFYVDVILDAGPQVRVTGSRAAQRSSRW